jgi:hypothetical protein
MNMNVIECANCGALCATTATPHADDLFLCQRCKHDEYTTGECERCGQFKVLIPRVNWAESPEDVRRGKYSLEPGDLCDECLVVGSPV